MSPRLFPFDDPMQFLEDLCRRDFDDDLTVVNRGTYISRSPPASPSSKFARPDKTSFPDPEGTISNISPARPRATTWRSWLADAPKPAANKRFFATSLKFFGFF